MKVIAINGSPRKGKNTTAMLRIVLAEASALGAETELIELADFNVKNCRGCNTCLRQPRCAIQDDDNSLLHEKMLAADGIILGSPCYFSNVSGLMKTFIDRTRCLHMTRNALKGKIGGALVHSGLRNGGQELALNFLHQYLITQGLMVASGFEPFRAVERPLFSGGSLGTMFNSMEGDKIVWYRSVEADPLAVSSCRFLGQNVVGYIELLSKAGGE